MNDTIIIDSLKFVSDTLVNSSHQIKLIISETDTSNNNVWIYLIPIIVTIIGGLVALAQVRTNAIKTSKLKLIEDIRDYFSNYDTYSRLTLIHTLNIREIDKDIEEKELELDRLYKHKETRKEGFDMTVIDRSLDQLRKHVDRSNNRYFQSYNQYVDTNSKTGIYSNKLILILRTHIENNESIGGLIDTVNNLFIGENYKTVQEKELNELLILIADEIVLILKDEYLKIEKVLHF